MGTNGAGTAASATERIFSALDGFRIEVPSWGFANTGTRFGKFSQAGAATTLEEKFADASEVNKLTGASPTVALHVLWDLPNGRWVTAAGLVITRQRPGSASGVTFVTMEDETGHVNLIVWKRVAEEQRAALLGSRLLEVRGALQREGDVLHVIAQRLTDLSALLGELVFESRDFR